LISKAFFGRPLFFSGFRTGLIAYLIALENGLKQHAMCAHHLCGSLWFAPGSSNCIQGRAKLGNFSRLLAQPARDLQKKTMISARIG
jgi:hypothetical protein